MLGYLKHHISDVFGPGLDKLFAYISNCRSNTLVGDTTHREDFRWVIDSEAVIFVVATRYAETTIGLQHIPARQCTYK